MYCPQCKIKYENKFKKKKVQKALYLPTHALRKSQSVLLILFLICFNFLKSTSSSSLLPIPAPDASSILWKSMFTSVSRFSDGGDLLRLLLQPTTPPTTPPTPCPTTLLLLSLSCSLNVEDGLSGSDASSIDSTRRLLGLGWSHTTHLSVSAQFS